MHSHSYQNLDQETHFLEAQLSLFVLSLIQNVTLLEALVVDLLQLKAAHVCREHTLQKAQLEAAQRQRALNFRPIPTLDPSKIVETLTKAYLELGNAVQHRPKIYIHTYSRWPSPGGLLCRSLGFLDRLRTK